MMEDHEFCDSCSGCRPAMLNVQTGKPLPATDPMMIKVNQIWDNDTSYAQRRAFIEVTLKNSENPRDRQLCMEVMHKIQQVIGGG